MGGNCHRTPCGMINRPRFHLPWYPLSSRWPRAMSEAGSADGAGQRIHRLCVVCGQRAEGRNVRHFNPGSFPVGFVPTEGDSVHDSCRPAVQRAAEAGARLAADQAAALAAAAPYPLRRLLQEVHCLQAPPPTDRSRSQHTANSPARIPSPTHGAHGT